MKALCQGCGEPVEIPVDGQPQFVNTPAISMVVVNHSKPGFCFRCNCKVGLFLRGGNLVFEAAAIDPPARSPILLAPANALPKERQ